MGLGIANVVLSGNVAGDVSFSTIGRSGEPVCSFTVIVERKRGELIWMKVNAYKWLADLCRGDGRGSATRLRKGVYVVVQGDLVPVKKNYGQEISIEVRAEDIKFVSDGREEEGNERHSPEAEDGPDAQGGQGASL